jgi:hypothetical protein
MDRSKDDQAVSSSSSSADKKQTKSDSNTSGSNSSSKTIDDSDKRVLKEALKCPVSYCTRFCFFELHKEILLCDKSSLCCDSN